MSQVANKIGLISFAILLFAVMTGCNGKNQGEQAFNYMEKAAAKEEGFNKQQKPLVAEEQKEQDLYQKIMKLGMDDYDKIKTISDEALKSVDQRKKMIETEKKSIDAAYDIFKKAVPYLKKVDNKKASPHAKKIIEDMNKRYDAYQTLYKAYSTSIEKDTKLFNLLKKKDLVYEDLQKQLKGVNAAYKTIDTQKDAFNKYTTAFNQEKQAFYKVLKLGDQKK